MLSAHFRTYSVSSAQPLHPSPKVLQLQGLPPPYPEHFVPGKAREALFPSGPFAQLGHLCAAPVVFLFQVKHSQWRTTKLSGPVAVLIGPICHAG